MPEDLNRQPVMLFHNLTTLSLAAEILSRYSRTGHLDGINVYF